MRARTRARMFTPLRTTSGSGGCGGGAPSSELTYHNHAAAIDADFAIDVTFNGPMGNAAALRQTAANLCPTNDLDSSYIADVLRARGAQIVIMYVSTKVGSDLSLLPVRLQHVLHRNREFPRGYVCKRATTLAAGFFVFSAYAPCILQYICLGAELRNLKLGSMLLAYYERLVASAYPDRCAALYVASVNLDRVRHFYERNGFVQIGSDAYTTPTSYEFVDRENSRQVVKLYSDTLLYTKRLGAKQAESSPPPPPQPIQVLANIISDDVDVDDDYISLVRSV